MSRFNEEMRKVSRQDALNRNFKQTLTEENLSHYYVWVTDDGYVCQWFTNSTEANQSAKNANWQYQDACGNSWPIHIEEEDTTEADLQSRRLDCDQENLGDKYSNIEELPSQIYADDLDDDVTGLADAMRVKDTTVDEYYDDGYDNDNNYDDDDSDDFVWDSLESNDNKEDIDESYYNGVDEYDTDVFDPEEYLSWTDYDDVLEAVDTRKHREPINDVANRESLEEGIIDAIKDHAIQKKVDKFAEEIADRVLRGSFGDTHAERKKAYHDADRYHIQVSLQPRDDRRKVNPNFMDHENTTEYNADNESLPCEMEISVSLQKYADILGKQDNPKYPDKTAISKVTDAEIKALLHKVIAKVKLGDRKEKLQKKSPFNSDNYTFRLDGAYNKKGEDLTFIFFACCSGPKNKKKNESLEEGIKDKIQSHKITKLAKQYAKEFVKQGFKSNQTQSTRDKAVSLANEHRIPYKVRIQGQEDLLSRQKSYDFATTSSRVDPLTYPQYSELVINLADYAALLGYKQNEPTPSLHPSQELSEDEVQSLIDTIESELYYLPEARKIAPFYNNHDLYFSSQVVLDKENPEYYGIKKGRIKLLWFAYLDY